MKEQSILHRILFACGVGHTRLFRQNTGVAWAGKQVIQVRRAPQHMTINPGDVVIRGAQPIRMGLCVGSSDIVGWRSRVMQPEDVGTRVAVFVGLEVKTDTGKVRPEQQVFIDQVIAGGGIAGVARCEADAIALLK